MRKKQNILGRNFGIGLCLTFVALLSSCEKQQITENTSVVTNPNPEKSMRIGATSKLRIGYLWFNDYCTNCLRDNILDLEKQTHKTYYQNLTHINLSFVNPTNDLGTSVAITESGKELSYSTSVGSFVLNQTKMKSLVSNLKSMNPKIRVGLAIGGGSANGVSETNIYKYYKAILPSSTKRAALVKSITTYAKNTGCDYLDIDLEYNSLTLTGFNEFVKECKQSGLNVTLTLEFKYEDKGVVTKVNNVKDAYNYCDLLNIMSYDYNDNSSASKLKDPNHSPVEVAKRDIKYFSGKVGIDKIVLGIPFYGRGAYCSGSTAQYSDISFSDINATTGLHSKTNTYFNSKDMIKSKLTVASDNGIAGVMFWSVRHDKISDYNNSMLKYIVDNQK